MLAASVVGGIAFSLSPAVGVDDLDGTPKLGTQLTALLPNEAQLEALASLVFLLLPIPRLCLTSDLCDTGSTAGGSDARTSPTRKRWSASSSEPEPTGPSLVMTPICVPLITEASIKYSSTARSTAAVCVLLLEGHPENQSASEFAIWGGDERWSFS